jgi:hypothetical protein
LIEIVYRLKLPDIRRFVAYFTLPHNLRRRSVPGDLHPELYYQRREDSKQSRRFVANDGHGRSAARPSPWPGGLNMFGSSQKLVVIYIGLIILFQFYVPSAGSQEPPALNPFGSKQERQDQSRDESVPGYLEISDGTIKPGRLSLTRDTRLKIFDEARKLHREVPLQAIKRIDCTVLKEWVEKEWRFKENANDEKYFTGRTYLVREYTHKITLQNGQTIQGSLSAIVYLQAESAEHRDRFLLHKRDKGEQGTDLKSMVYVRSIRLGANAFEEGKRPRSRRGR